MRNMIDAWKKIENPRYRLRVLQNLAEYCARHRQNMGTFAATELARLKRELGA